MFCGIDPGLDGAIAFLSPRGELVALHSMPTRTESHGKRDVDVRAVREIVFPRVTSLDLCAIEHVHSFGVEARSRLWRFGVGTGKLLACLDLWDVKYVEPSPQDWKDVVLKGTKKDKACAVGYAAQRWPGCERRVEGGDSFRHDHAEALCIAEYARRQVVGV